MLDCESWLDTPERAMQAKIRSVSWEILKQVSKELIGGLSEIIYVTYSVEPTFGEKFMKKYPALEVKHIREFTFSVSLRIPVQEKKVDQMTNRQIIEKIQLNKLFIDDPINYKQNMEKIQLDELKKLFIRTATPRFIIQSNQ